MRCESMQAATYGLAGLIGVHLGASGHKPERSWLEISTDPTEKTATVTAIFECPDNGVCVTFPCPREADTSRILRMFECAIGDPGALVG